MIQPRRPTPLARPPVARTLAPLLGAPALLALTLGAACGGGSGGTASPAAFEYTARAAATSPWPQMRRTHRNDARSPVLPRGDGEPWKFQTGKGIFSIPVIGHDDTVLVGSADRFFYAIHPDGSEKWRFETGEIIDSAASVGADGTIFVPSGDGHVYGLNPDGSERWRFRAHHRTGEDERDGTACGRTVTSGPSNWFEGNVVIGADGRLYAGNDNYRMYALDQDGREQYAFNPGPIPFGAVWSAPTSWPDGSIVFGALDFFLYALDPDGSCKWKTALGAPISSTPAQSGDGATVYVGSWDDHLYAVDAESGAVRWRFAARDHIYSSAAVAADGTIYFGSTDGTFYALEPDGTLAWTYDVIDPIRSSPSIAGDGTVFFSAGNGTVYALHPDGTRWWSYDATTQDRNDLNSSPVLGRGALYVGGEDGTVLGLPYEHCPRSTDERCSEQESEDLPADGALLYYVTPGGRTFESLPGPVQRGSALTFRLVLRAGGDTLRGGFDRRSLSVWVDPPFPFEQLEQPGGEFVNVIPAGMLAADTAYTITLSGPWSAETGESGEVSETFTFRTVPELAAPALTVGEDAVTGIRMRNMAPYQPSVIVSLNQIGFDSVDFLASVVHEHPGGRYVLWLTSALIGSDGEAIDPAPPSMASVDAVFDGASFVMDAGTLGFVTGGPPLVTGQFRIASQLDAEGAFDEGTSLIARAGCFDQGIVAPALFLFGMCNRELDFASVGTLRGRLASGPLYERPANVTLRSLERAGAGGRTFRATFEAPGYRLDEHLPAIVLIDDATGVSVDLDYDDALTGAADGAGDLASVELVVPADVPLPARTRAVVMTDLFPIESRVLESPAS